MKKISLILVALSIGLIPVLAQITEGEDGIYYDKNKKPYTGVFTEYWPNGNLKMELPIKKGLKDGQANLYFENSGKNEIRSFKGGKMHGTWVTWNEKGTKIAEANYLNGKKHGKWLIWDDNGILRYDMTYKKGDKTGTWLMWDEEGKIIMEKSHGKKK